MSLLMVDQQNGTPLTNEAPTTSTPEVEEHQEPLHIIAAREAERQSTKKHK